MKQSQSGRRWLVALGILLAFLLVLRLTHSPAHRDLPIDYTDHARQRMAQRDIAPAEVEQVVREGSWSPGSEAGRFEAVRTVRSPGTNRPRRLRAVLMMEDRRILIITAIVETRVPRRGGH